MLKTGKYSRVRTLPVPTDSEKKVFVSNGWQRNLRLLFEDYLALELDVNTAGLSCSEKAGKWPRNSSKRASNSNTVCWKPSYYLVMTMFCFFFISTRSSEERVKRGLNINRETGEENSLERTVNIKTRMLWCRTALRSVDQLERHLRIDDGHRHQSVLRCRKGDAGFQSWLLGRRLRRKADHIPGDGDGERGDSVLLGGQGQQRQHQAH